MDTTKTKPILVDQSIGEQTLSRVYRYLPSSLDRRAANRYMRIANQLELASSLEWGAIMAEQRALDRAKQLECRPVSKNENRYEEAFTEAGKARLQAAYLFSIMSSGLEREEQLKIALSDFSNAATVWEFVLKKIPVDKAFAATFAAVSHLSAADVIKTLSYIKNETGRSDAYTEHRDIALELYKFSAESAAGAYGSPQIMLRVAHDQMIKAVEIAMEDSKPWELIRELSIDAIGYGIKHALQQVRDPKERVRELSKLTKEARDLKVSGLFDIAYLLRDRSVS